MKKFGIGDFRIREISHTMDGERTDWSIRHGGFDKTGYTGKGERISVLDTGIDANHRDMRGSVDAYNFIKGCKDNPPYFDNSSHGTFCASQIISRENGFGIIGVAPESTCFSGKVLYGTNKDRTIRGFDIWLSEAIKASVHDGCGVISMSLGMNYDSWRVKEAIAYAVDSGVLVFSAAGNDGMQGSLYRNYPASYEDVISVASSNALDLAHWYSTAGIGNNPLENPELSISSLEYFWACYPGNKYGKMTGTSQACPTAAGVALLWRQAMREKDLLPTGRDVLNTFRIWLRKNCYDSNGNGWDNLTGFGVLKLKNGINL